MSASLVEKSPREVVGGRQDAAADERDARGCFFERHVGFERVAHRARHLPAPRKRLQRRGRRQHGSNPDPGGQERRKRRHDFRAGCGCQQHAAAVHAGHARGDTGAMSDSVPSVGSPVSRNRDRASTRMRSYDPWETINWRWSVRAPQTTTDARRPRSSDSFPAVDAPSGGRETNEMTRVSDEPRDHDRPSAPGSSSTIRHATRDSSIPSRDVIDTDSSQLPSFFRFGEGRAVGRQPESDLQNCALLHALRAPTAARRQT